MVPNKQMPNLAVLNATQSKQEGFDTEIVTNASEQEPTEKVVELQLSIINYLPQCLEQI